jgi:hypothetical protein
VFRYNRHDVAREYLGSFMEIASAVGNLGPGEEFPKGHTRMIFADSQMYMGSQGFHDFKREITALPNYRGGHIFAYDTRSGVWDDLAAEQVGGVLIRHEGIVALNVLPGENLLVGLTHPLSNILLYDYKTRVIDRVVPGIQLRRTVTSTLFAARRTQRTATPSIRFGSTTFTMVK